MTQPESSLILFCFVKCLFIYTHFYYSTVSLCTKQLYLIKNTNTSHSSDYKKRKLSGTLTAPCTCSCKIIWCTRLRVQQSTGCIRSERRILPVHLFYKVLCIFICTFQVRFPNGLVIVDYFILKNLLCSDYFCNI